MYILVVAATWHLLLNFVHHTLLLMMLFVPITTTRLINLPLLVTAGQLLLYLLLYPFLPPPAHSQFSDHNYITIAAVVAAQAAAAGRHPGGHPSSVSPIRSASAGGGAAIWIRPDGAVLFSPDSSAGAGAVLAGLSTTLDWVAVLVGLPPVLIGLPPIVAAAVLSHGLYRRNREVVTRKWFDGERSTCVRAAVRSRHANAYQKAKTLAREIEWISENNLITRKQREETKEIQECKNSKGAKVKPFEVENIQYLYEVLVTVGRKEGHVHYTLPPNNKLRLSTCAPIFIEHGENSWDRDLVLQTFYPFIAEEILKIPLSQCGTRDKLIWHWTRKILIVNAHSSKRGWIGMKGTLWKDGKTWDTWSGAKKFLGPHEETWLRTLRWVLEEGKRRNIDGICCCLNNKNLSARRVEDEDGRTMEEKVT
ncbi:60S ribosomal protein L38 [Striga asiatica]|uniref:60S ribosomal protein L38 n=1 Tax=Striga asiatica TaxID=4170 RepID=A0A5A7NYP8_STRAF|nr:60S ribosomal protein L38 [Striga asiatica]